MHAAPVLACFAESAARPAFFPPAAVVAMLGELGYVFCAPDEDYRLGVACALPYTQPAHQPYSERRAIRKQDL